MTQRKEQAATRAWHRLADTRRQQAMATSSLPLADNVESIFGAATLAEETVDLPALGISVLVRGLTVAEADDVTQRSMRINKDGSIAVDFEKQRLFKLMYAIKNPATGKTLFNPSEHYYRLKTMPAGAFGPAEKALRRLMGEDDEGGDAMTQQADAAFPA